MDPLSYFIYEEFFDPGMKYECQQCGTRFCDECVTWDETPNAMLPPARPAAAREP